MGKMEIKELSSKVLDAYHSKSELLKTFENLSDTILDHIGGLPINQNHWQQFQQVHITNQSSEQLKEQAVFFYRELLQIWQLAEKAKSALLADTQITREEVKSYGTAVQDVIDTTRHYLTRYQSLTTVLNVKDVGIKVCGNPNENSIKSSLKIVFAYGCQMSDILFNKVIPAVKELEFMQQITPAEVKPADDKYPGCEHNEDFTWVKWNGIEYSFNTRQADIVKYLWEKKVIAQCEIANRFDYKPDNFQLSKVFKNSDAWGTMIIKTDGNQKGMFRLNYGA